MWATSPDGAVVRGVLWEPGTGSWNRGVLLAHPRGDFSVHYAAPLLAAAGFGVLGIATRSVNNDADCVHEQVAVDTVTAARWLRSRGAEQLIALGNCGGAALSALAQVEFGLDADLFAVLTPHLGPGQILRSLLDPSIIDEADPNLRNPDLDMFHPDNGWRPWPAESRYDSQWLARYRAGQAERVKRIDALATTAAADAAAARAEARDQTPGTARWAALRRRAVRSDTLVIHGTLANPAHLDLTIEPDARPLGSCLFPGDPLIGNSGYGGLARYVTARAWRSTWSATTSAADFQSLIGKIECPMLLLHANGDSEIRWSEATQLARRAGPRNFTYRVIQGAPHYLQGFRREALDNIIEWLNDHQTS